MGDSVAVVIVAAAPIVPPVAVAVSIPVMVVLEAASVALPIAGIKPLAIVAGTDPARTFVRRTGPIAVMPPPAVSHRIPIAIQPQKVRPGRHRAELQHAGRRWSANLNANRDLAEDRSRGQKHERE